jgi:hypothetical protein
MVETVRHWYCACIPSGSGQTAEIARSYHCCRHCCNRQLSDRIFRFSLLPMMLRTRKHSVPNYAPSNSTALVDCQNDAESAKKPRLILQPLRDVQRTTSTAFRVSPADQTFPKFLVEKPLPCERLSRRRQQPCDTGTARAFHPGQAKPQRLSEVGTVAHVFATVSCPIASSSHPCCP